MKPRGFFVVARASAGAVCALGLCALLTGSALAASSPRPSVAVKPATRRHAARAHRAAGSHALGMRATIDPATGRLVPAVHPTDAPGTTVPGANAPAAASQPVVTGATPQVTTLADGTQLVLVPPDQQEYEVVHVGKDGKLVRACVHGDPKAATFRTREEK